MLGDAFKNIWNICLKIYELDLARFLTVLRLAWEAALKNTVVKLDLLTDIDMLLMVKKTYVMLFIVMWKLVTITWKVMIDESSYLKYWDVKICMDGQCLRDLDGFKWV